MRLKTPASCRGVGSALVNSIAEESFKYVDTVTSTELLNDNYACSLCPSLAALDTIYLHVTLQAFIPSANATGKVY
jgi:hypothetical protein